MSRQVEGKKGLREENSLVNQEEAGGGSVCGCGGGGGWGVLHKTFLQHMTKSQQCNKLTSSLARHYTVSTNGCVTLNFETILLFFLNYSWAGIIQWNRSFFSY